MEGLEFGVYCFKFGVFTVGLRVQDLGFLGFRKVKGSGLQRIEHLGFRAWARFIQGSEFRVQTDKVHRV